MLSAALCRLSGHVRPFNSAPYFHCHRCGKFFDPREDWPAGFTLQKSPEQTIDALKGGQQ